jgi:hypothetical protein
MPKDKDKADYWLIMFIQGASIQDLQKLVSQQQK